jgi:hypothetical protein
MVKAKTRSKNRKQNRTHKFHGKANVSTMAMRAVSDDGSNWHVDTDVNGVRNHANLTNSDIMNIMSHPAHKLDLRTRLLQSLRGVDRHTMPTLLETPETPETDQIGMFGEIDSPHLRIYRKNCPMIPKHRLSRPVMMNNLSPLHEATIVPRNEVIHIMPLHSLHTMKVVKPAKKRPTKGKQSRKNRK